MVTSEILISVTSKSKILLSIDSLSYISDVIKVGYWNFICKKKKGIAIKLIMETFHFLKFSNSLIQYFYELLHKSINSNNLVTDSSNENNLLHTKENRECSENLLILKINNLIDEIISIFLKIEKLKKINLNILFGEKSKILTLLYFLKTMLYFYFLTYDLTYENLFVTLNFDLFLQFTVKYNYYYGNITLNDKLRNQILFKHDSYVLNNRNFLIFDTIN